jgi:integrase
MGRKRNPGLVFRAGAWHIDKRIAGRRICQSTRSDCLEEAERYLARLIEQNRQAEIYGVRPVRTFEQAAARFVLERQHKHSLVDDIGRFRALMPWIGKVPLDKLHMDVRQPWIEHRQREGVASGTINHGLQLVRRILNLASGVWRDERGLTWLLAPAKIKLLPRHQTRQPYPLSWDEQSLFFTELPPHLVEMALFGVNSGCRDGEICHLRWGVGSRRARTRHLGVHHSGD